VENTSSAPDHFRINLLTLSFSKDIEKEFLDSYFKNSLRQVRIALLLGLCLYSIFGILDAWLVHPASYTYYAGLLLVFIYGYTFVKLRFIWASITGWLIVFAYEIAAIWLSPIPVPILIGNNFFFLSANILSMFTCYSIEYYSRRNFMQARWIEAEKKKVSEINRELESRVLERTAQLVEINKDLKQEITERKRSEKERRYLEAQLAKSQKMEAIGTLAGGVAHDLNNILSGLVSYPELLLMDLPEKSPLRQPILTIQASGQKAAAIVQDLLTLARRGVSIREAMNLNQLIEEYLNSPENLKILENNPGVTVETNLKADLFNMMGSPVHLSKTIMNLVSNAAEAMPNGGKISITTENRYIDKSLKGYDVVDEGDYSTLTIMDTGIGISAEDTERIFEPFYTKKSMGRSGTGLGMAVVWGTVKDHHGYVDVQSEVGVGSTFTLYFPITRKKLPLETQSISAEIYKGNGESILIVDDIEEQREIASGMLKKLGYNVNSVPSGEEALAYIQENGADLLVLDMIMNPGMDGLETYQKILKFHPEQKAVIASGYSESKHVKKAQRIGAGTYVKKPYSFEKIGLAVKGELSK
jgi:signal transduction histidine kinase